MSNPRRIFCKHCGRMHVLRKKQNALQSKGSAVSSTYYRCGTKVYVCGTVKIKWRRA